MSLGLILPDFSTFFALNERVSYSFGVRRLLTGATSSRPPAPPSRPVLRKSKKPHSVSCVFLATTFLGLENFLPTAQRKINERASARQLTSCVFGATEMVLHSTHTHSITRVHVERWLQATACAFHESEYGQRCNPNGEISGGAKASEMVGVKHLLIETSDERATERDSAMVGGTNAAERPTRAKRTNLKSDIVGKLREGLEMTASVTKVRFGLPDVDLPSWHLAPHRST